MDETTPASESLPERSPKITAALIPKVNLASFQNAVPLLRELAIVNESEQELREFDLTVTSQPPFLRRKTWHIESVSAGQHFRLTDLDLQVDGAYLLRLTESESVIVSFVISRRHPDSGGELPREQVSGIDLTRGSLDVRNELLPRNHWGGIGNLADFDRRIRTAQ